MWTLLLEGVGGVSWGLPAGQGAAARLLAPKAGWEVGRALAPHQLLPVETRGSAEIASEVQMPIFM